MQKVRKKEIWILSIFLLNIIFITIPYSLKNTHLKNAIELEKSLQKTIENKEGIDFYAVYQDFHSILEELGIEFVHIQTDMEEESMKITLVADFKQKEFSNLLISLHKKIPQMSLLSASIDFAEESTKEVTFYIKNT